MPAPSITALPDLSSKLEQEFSSESSAFLSALSALPEEINNSIEYARETAFNSGRGSVYDDNQYKNRELTINKDNTVRFFTKIIDYPANSTGHEVAYEIGFGGAPPIGTCVVLEIVATYGHRDNRDISGGQRAKYVFMSDGTDFNATQLYTYVAHNDTRRITIGYAFGATIEVRYQIEGGSSGFGYNIGIQTIIRTNNVNLMEVKIADTDGTLPATAQTVVRDP